MGIRDQEEEAAFFSIASGPQEETVSINCVLCPYLSRVDRYELTSQNMSTLLLVQFVITYSRENFDEELSF